MDGIQRHSPSGKKDEHGNVFEHGMRHIHEFILDGEKIGRAELSYFSRPIKFYCLQYIEIDPEHTGKGHGSGLMAAVEYFLKEKKAAGILIDIMDPEEDAYGMYERRGWKKMDLPSGQEDNWYGYNLPENVDEITMWRMVRKTAMEQASLEGAEIGKERRKEIQVERFGE